MKILFIADHHIKLGQKNVPKDWARKRFFSLWEEIRNAAESNQVDCIMHGGDIFDRVPSPEEVGIMLDMLNTLKSFHNIVYPGNHEATTKYKSFWQEFKSLEDTYDLKIYEEFTELEPGVFILPYTELKKKEWHGSEGKLLFTHVRGAIEPHVKPEIDLDLFNKWDTVIAGDLHAHSNSQRNIVYPGSPVNTSFRRSEVLGENGYIVVNTDTTNYSFHSLQLPQLIRSTVNNPDDMVTTEFHHTIYELVGDVDDLSSVKNIEVLDKKITNRNAEAAMKTPDMSIEEELSWYLEEVENIVDQAKRQEIVDEYVNIERSSLV